jgi:hypothetical protein
VDARHKAGHNKCDGLTQATRALRRFVESNVIIKTFFRFIWVAVVFCIAIGVALAALFALGALWVGDELRAAAPQDPMLRHGAAPIFGIVLFTSTVTPALTALPALVAAMVGEVLRIRSWMYYVLAGGASLVAIPLLVTRHADDLQALPASSYLTIFAAAGFAGGFIYWLLAGARA